SQVSRPSAPTRSSRKTEALLTSTVRGPRAAAACAVRARAAVSSARSAWTMAARRPDASMAAATSAASPGLARWCTATSKPAPARVRAICRPMRRAPPVTSAASRAGSVKPAELEHVERAHDDQEQGDDGDGQHERGSGKGLRPNTAARPMVQARAMPYERDMTWRRRLEPLTRPFFFAVSRLTRGMTLGVRGVAFDPEGRVLLVEHTYLEGWWLPGGGVDRGETAQQAVRSEEHTSELQ